MYMPKAKWTGPFMSLDPYNLSSMETAIAADDAARKFNDEMAEIRRNNMAVYEEWVKNVKISVSGSRKLTDAWFGKYREAIGYPWNDYVKPQYVERLTKILDDIQIKKLTAEKETEEKLTTAVSILAAAEKLGLTRQPEESATAFSARVWECASDAYRNEYFPDGESVEIDCCDECSHWTVGERRCNCGNVRVNVVVEPRDKNDISKGFYEYAERY